MRLGKEIRWAQWYLWTVSRGTFWTVMWKEIYGLVVLKRQRSNFRDVEVTKNVYIVLERRELCRKQNPRKLHRVSLECLLNYEACSRRLKVYDFIQRTTVFYSFKLKVCCVHTGEEMFRLQPDTVKFYWSPNKGLKQVLKASKLILWHLTSWYKNHNILHR